VQVTVFKSVTQGSGRMSINEPAPRFQPGGLLGQCSSLYVVSIRCAAFQQFAPGQDVGIDLSREYEAAQQTNGRTVSGES
jgi:hypothetical protein